MSIKKILTTGLLLSTLGVAAQAQSLVYCSEGSPEGFDPALFTAGTHSMHQATRSTTG